MTQPKNISGIILSGGKSSRMGIDKASLRLDDKTFMEHVISVMKSFVVDITIISDNLEHDAFNLRREEDFIKDSGPLGGLHSGLFYAKHEDVLVLSCDIPLISKEIVSTLIHNADFSADVNQIESKGKTMPLIALYKKSCRDTFYKFLNDDERRVRVVLKSLKTNAIKINSNLDNHVQNINTKEEFETLKTCK
ncbi:MAG: molybdenum cofactor guanylyltransferase [Flavobacteriaceae bacterium]|nr:molybdenum cofactor guanylyltransferase [Flavobacteriaceae bacterium]